jgi:Phage X family/Phage replication protein CRI
LNLITCHKALTDERTDDQITGKPYQFIDWLEMYQSHPQELPLVSDGAVTGVDKEGQIVWRSERGFRLKGSFESSVSVKCDGHTVKFSGNPARFGRPDNVFGFDLPTSIRRVNLILAQLGLPPFTAGRRILKPKTTKGLNFADSVQPLESIKQLHLVAPDRVKLYRHTNESLVDVEWTGARFTRLDYTANYSLGSKEDGATYLSWLLTQQPSRRQLVGTYPNSATVDWGRGSRRIYAKFYLKFIELAQRGLASPELLEWAEKVGLARFEMSLKSTQLISMGCQFLGSLDMNQLELLFEEKTKILSRASVAHDDFESLPDHLRLVALEYQQGKLKPMAVSTFRRKRLLLLPYGIDISVPSNIHQFPQRVRVIELRPASIPEFYQLDERLAA